MWSDVRWGFQRRWLRCGAMVGCGDSGKVAARMLSLEGGGLRGDSDAWR